jgi:hypothetical protein
MKKFWLSIVLVLVAQLSTAQAFSGTYTFASVTTTSGTTDPTAVPTATGITFGSFTSTGASANPNATGRFSFTDWATGATASNNTYTSHTGSVNTSEYFEVTVTPAAGFTMDVNSITFTVQRSGTGIRTYAVRSSLDGFAANLPASINPANTDLSVQTGDVFYWALDANISAETGSTITLGTSFDGLSSALTFRFYGWNSEANTGSFSIDDVVISGIANPSCSPPAQPSTAASNSSTANLGCNSFVLSWINGDGANRLVVVKAGSAVSPPVDLSAYTANNTLGSGSAISGGYVTYAGSGNSVFINGLSASTTYYWGVYEYNGSSSCINYLTTSAASGSITTTGCTEPLGITGIYIDACPSSCVYEGNNEVIWGQTGSYGFEVATNGPVVQYNSSTPPTSTYISTYATNSGNITTLNSAVSSCGTTTFVDPNTQGYIPPNSKFLIANNCMCSPSAYDFSALCGAGPIYTIFGTNAAWPCNTTGGIFGNSTGCAPPTTAVRYVEFDFNPWGINTVPIYSYDICQLTSTGDGDYVLFNPSGGAAINYNNNACVVPLIILPLELISFTASESDGGAALSWVTAGESSLQKITLQKSYDGINFSDVKDFTPYNLQQLNYYSWLDENPFDGNSYYRLLITEISGSVSASESILFYKKKISSAIIYADHKQLYYTLRPGMKNVTLRLSGAGGRSVFQQTLQGESGQLEFSQSGISSGLYFVELLSESEKIKCIKIIVP